MDEIDLKRVVTTLQESADERGAVDHTLPEFKELVDHCYNQWKRAIDLLGKEDWENEDN